MAGCVYEREGARYSEVPTTRRACGRPEAVVARRAGHRPWTSCCSATAPGRHQGPVVGGRREDQSLCGMARSRERRGRGTFIDADGGAFVVLRLVRLTRIFRAFKSPARLSRRACWGASKREWKGVLSAPSEVRPLKRSCVRGCESTGNVVGCRFRVSNGGGPCCEHQPLGSRSYGYSSILSLVRAVGGSRR